MDDKDYDVFENKENKNNNDGYYPQVRYQPYYKEKHEEKRTAKKIGIIHLVMVAIISSILGGGIVFTVFQFVAPAIQPSVNSYFSKMVSQSPASNSIVVNENDVTYKKVEIEKTDSPIIAIAEKVSPSIVGIRVKANHYNFFFGQREGSGEGSGIIIREDGYILTNNHVIEAAMESMNSNKLQNDSKIEVVLWNDQNKAYEATVIGRDSRTDLAVLKINGSGLPAADMGDSDNLKPGELAVAIGNPGGFMGSVTAGIISGLDRTIEADEKEFTLIQTDAAINPGNSGGALVNSAGEVIGVNTIKIVAAGYEGLGFAIPINQAKEIYESLIEHKYVKGRPLLGIKNDPRLTEELAERNNVPMGVLVYEVLPFTGAYKSGIKASDIITHFNGVRIKSFEELEEQKNKHKPGDVVEIKIYRIDNLTEGDKEMTFNVELGEDKQ